MHLNLQSWISLLIAHITTENSQYSLSTGLVRWLSGCYSRCRLRTRHWSQTLRKMLVHPRAKVSSWRLTVVPREGRLLLWVLQLIAMFLFAADGCARCHTSTMSQSSKTHFIGGLLHCSDFVRASISAHPRRGCAGKLYRISPTPIFGRKFPSSGSPTLILITTNRLYVIFEASFWPYLTKWLTFLEFK